MNKETEVKNCTQCKNHCPIDQVQCPRGEEFAAFLKKGGNPEEFVGSSHHKGDGHGEKGHNHGGRTGHEGRGGFKGGEKPEDLLGLMRACGHALHHGNAGDEFFDALSAEEKEQLKAILKKLV